MRGKRHSGRAVSRKKKPDGLVEHLAIKSSRPKYSPQLRCGARIQIKTLSNQCQLFFTKSSKNSGKVREFGDQHVQMDARRIEDDVVEVAGEDLDMTLGHLASVRRSSRMMMREFLKDIKLYEAKQGKQNPLTPA